MTQKALIQRKILEVPSAKKFVELVDIIKLLSLKTGIDLQSYEASLAHTIAVQNLELFPFLHEQGVVDPKNGKIYLSQVDTITFVQLMSKVVPEINIEIATGTKEEIMNLIWPLPWTAHLNQGCLKNQDCQLLIRREDYKVYRFTNLQKQTERSSIENMYLDPLDAEMIQKKIDEINSQPTQQQNLKWLNLCWDAFRIVDNHSKSHIFQTVTPSHLQSRQLQVQPVEQIKDKLQKRVYRSLEEFDNDMSSMFQDWLTKNQPRKKNAGEGHRYFRTALAIQDRFNKSIARAREKLSDFEIKAQSKK